MSRINQIRFNSICIARQAKARKWAKVKFHFAGLVRALRGV
jgi:hypothetical protein